MKKTIGIFFTTFFIIGFIPLTFCFALHDDEAIGKGGAWKSDDIKTDQPVSSDNEESIDGKLDNAFEKSPIIIPTIEQELKDQESDDPENKDKENSGSSGQ